MERRRRRPPIFFAGILAVSIPVSSAPGELSSVLNQWSDAIIGRVNSEPILFSELVDAAMAQGIATSSLLMGGMNGDAFRKAFTAVADEELLVQRARLEEIQVDEAEIARRVDLLIQQQVQALGGEVNFRHLIRGQNLSLESIRRRLTDQERRQDMATLIVTQRVTVTSAEVESFKTARMASGEPFEEVRLGQILVRCPRLEQATPIGREQFRKALDFAQDVGKEPKRFEAIVQQHAEAPDPRVLPSGLGWLDPHRLREELRERVLDMRLNEISEPIASDEGYHVLLILGRRTPRDLLYAEKFEGERSRLLIILRSAPAKIDLYPEVLEQLRADQGLSVPPPPRSDP